MAQELNGLIPQIMGSFRQAKRNPNFNPEQAVSDTNTPYMETGLWGRFLGDDSNKRNNAYMEQKLANKMEMDRAAVAPTINAQSAERMHAAPSGNALMQDRTSRWLHDTLGADTQAQLTSREGIEAAGRELSRNLAGMHSDDIAAGRVAEAANLAFARNTPQKLDPTIVAGNTAQTKQIQATTAAQERANVGLRSLGDGVWEDTLGTILGMTKPGLAPELQPGMGVLRSAPLSPDALKSLEDIRVRNKAKEDATKASAKKPIAELGVDPGMADKIGKVIQQLLPGGAPAVRQPISNFGGF